MNILMQKKALGLFVDILGRKKNIGKIQHYTQKPRFKKSSGYTGSSLPRSTPEREGVSSRYILEFLEEAQGHPTINPHTIMVLRNGKVISECSFAPYRREVWHVTHSMCKGVTALAIGMLVDMGKLSLEDRLCDIFPGRLSPLGNPLSFRRFKNITVRHLLTMTSGVTFNETGAVTAEDWVRSFFESGVKTEPGTEFSYNSMNTYMLSAIVREKTGGSLVQFLRPRLFVPLGMGRLHWETCPKGIEKGGWGLYLCPEDMAKLGQLMLQRGVWNGRKLVSEAFIEEMTAKQVDTPPEMGEQGYGFQVWRGMREGSYLFNGILGQNIIVMPDIQLVIVTTGGNDCLFKNSTIISLVEKYFDIKRFAPDRELPQDKAALKALRSYEESAVNRLAMFAGEEEREGLLSLASAFIGGDKLPVQCRLLDGRYYNVSPGGARLLPLFTQLMQNNFSTGIDSFSFTIREGCFYINVGEGETQNKIKLSFNGKKPLYSTITVNGESYLVSGSARFATDEDGNTVLKILLPFIENSNGRSIKIFFYRGGKVEVRLTEFPDPEELLEDAGMFSNKTIAVWMNRLVARDDGDVFEYTVRRAVEPRVRGKTAE